MKPLTRCYPIEELSGAVRLVRVAGDECVYQF